MREATRYIPMSNEQYDAWLDKLMGRATGGPVLFRGREKGMPKQTDRENGSDSENAFPIKGFQKNKSDQEGQDRMSDDDAERAEVEFVNATYNPPRKFGEIGPVDLLNADKRVLTRLVQGAIQDDGFDGEAERFVRASRELTTPAGMAQLVKKFVCVGGR